MDIKLVEWKSDIVYIVQRVYVYDMLIDLGVWVYVCVYVCLLRHVYIYCYGCRNEQERPYHDDSTASRLLSEVKHRRAWLVLRWGTTLESQVLFFCFLLLFHIAQSTTSYPYQLHTYLIHYAYPSFCTIQFQHISYNTQNKPYPFGLYKSDAIICQ